MDPFQRRLVFRRAILAAALFVALLVAGTVLLTLVGDESGEEAFYRALGVFDDCEHRERARHDEGAWRFPPG